MFQASCLGSVVSNLARQVVFTCHIFIDIQVLLLVVAYVRIWFATSYTTILVLGKDYVDDCNEFFNQGCQKHFWLSFLHVNMNLCLACNGFISQYDNLWSTQKPKTNFIHTNSFSVLFDIVLGLL